MDFTFNFKGEAHTAVNAGWEKNGETVYDILDTEGEFVTSVTVHPFDHISIVIDKWIQTELCFA